MAATLTSGEQAQLMQTVEMFEVITQSQPEDYQSLEILREAYAKLGMEAEDIATSKKIGDAYVLMGQYSSAIMEYESILQRRPADPEIRQALADIEAKASSLTDIEDEEDEAASESPAGQGAPSGAKASKAPKFSGDVGRDALFKVFVDGNVLNPTDFEVYWNSVDWDNQESFIECLANRNILSVEESLKLISDKSRAAFLQLDAYDVNVDLARQCGREICLRWKVLPIDRLSRVNLVATVNPFNKLAAKELQDVFGFRIVWYLAHPNEISNLLRRIFR